MGIQSFEASNLADGRAWLSPVIQTAMETLVLAMVVLAPWAFGAVEPLWERWFYVGVATLSALWAIQILIQGSSIWRFCPVALCLAGMVLFAAFQIIPLPRDLLGFLSPNTAGLYGRLLPNSPEQFLHPIKLPDVAAGSTLSVYPYASERDLFRLLALLCLYLVTRTCIASPASLRRLSVACVLSGGALSLFGLVQYFTSAPNVVYWHITTRGSVFGPFICRNHFPFYVNICFGLGAGLLWGRYAAHGKKSLLQDPLALWISFALVLMAAAVVFSVSRGGLLAFLGGGILCLTLLFKRSTRFLHLESALLIVACVVGLVAWFGLERIQDRLGTLFQGQLLKDDRASLLSRVPPLIKDFPIWGTGFGSLDYVEPIYRTDASDAGWTYQHAHNEYLEALIEGGIIRLLLTLTAIVLVYRLGYRAYRRFQGHAAEGLLLGCLFGFTTLVLHSFVDFGIHIPAIAILATVVCAHMTALGSTALGSSDLGRSALGIDRASYQQAPLSPGTPGERGRGEGVGTSRSLGFLLLHFTSAAALVCLGVLLFLEGRRGARVQLLSEEALALRGRTEIPDQLKRIALLKAASALDPRNAHLHLELGERHTLMFEAINKQKQQRNDLLEAADLVVTANPGCAAAASANGIPSFALAARLHIQQRTDRFRELGTTHIVPALWHYLQARDLNPTRPRPHLEIALWEEFFYKADPRKVYLERTLFLDPANPELWYRAGIVDLRDGQPARAWDDWRRSLELSNGFLKNILDRSLRRLGPQEVLDRVLPQQPGIIVLAATYLYQQPEAPERRPFFERAKRLYQSLPRPWDAQDLHDHALAQAYLGQSKEAVADYQQALRQKPEQFQWRYELATVLFQLERFPDARRELLTVVAMQPKFDSARTLLIRTEREIAKGGPSRVR